jgi:ABC-type glycerol-3-phosphate transport system substrate-binding protein
MKRTKRLLLVGLVLVFAISLLGCAPAAAPTEEPAEEAAEEPAEEAAEEPAEEAAEEPAEEAAEEPAEDVVELVWMRFSEGHDVELELMDEFNAAHPNIHVTADTVPAEDNYSKLVLTTEAGTPPDVYMTYFTLGAATNGLSMDLTPFIEAEGEEWFNNLSPNGWAFHEYAGAYYAAPWRVAPGMIIVNNNLLEKAGLELPAGEWTWDEFLEYAQAMTNPADDEYGFCIMGSAEDPGTDYQFYPYLFQAGGVMINDEGLSGFNTNAGAEALQFLTDMINEYQVVPPGTTSATANTCIDLLAADKVGMWLNASLWLGIIRSTYPEADISLAPAPVNARGSTLVGGTGLGMSPDTEHPEEAWEFIKFMISDDSMRRWATAFDFTPPNVTLLEDPEFTSNPDQAAVAYTILNQTMYSLSHYPNNAELESILRSYIQAAYLEDMAPDEALAMAAAEWDPILVEYQGDDWWAQWLK